MRRRRLLIFEDHFRRSVHPSGETAEVPNTEAAERIGFLKAGSQTDAIDVRLIV